MIETALAQLNALADPQRAIDSAAYHKADRPYLGLRVPQIEELTDQWRADCTLDARLALAAALWDTNIHEARVAAAVGEIGLDRSKRGLLASAWECQVAVFSGQVALAGTARRAVWPRPDGAPGST